MTSILHSDRDNQEVCPVHRAMVATMQTLMPRDKSMFNDTRLSNGKELLTLYLPAGTWQMGTVALPPPLDIGTMTAKVTREK